MVPVVSLIGLWAFATVTTAQDVDTLTRLKQVDRGLITPVDSTLTALQAERTAALAYLAAPSADRQSRLTARAQATDAAVAAMHDSIQRSAGATAELTPTLDPRLAQLDRATAGLADLRAQISRRPRLGRRHERLPAGGRRGLRRRRVAHRDPRHPSPPTRGCCWSWRRPARCSPARTPPSSPRRPRGG
ncbi:nitrate- and nitrite sensing domain-containing protein [Streptacidiphilus monticola]